MDPEPESETTTATTTVEEESGLARGIFRPKPPQPQIPKPELKERDGSLVEVEVRDDTLQNWGGNIAFRPKFLFVPKTKEGACEVVKWASANNHRVRTSAYRHTWNNAYSDDGQVQITFLSPRHINSDLSATNDPHPDKTGAGEDFRRIEFVDGCKTPGHAFCRVGSAVTNDEFREFCNETEYKGSHWTLPLNVILVENTLCGTVSNICHGSGATNRTLSDLVVEIEFVNANGVLQKVSKIEAENELMKSAAGAFGLLGVITSLTITLDKMSFAVLKPKIEELLVSVPPPKGTQIHDLPKHLQYKFYRQEELDEMIRSKSAEFHAHCQNDYYAEWFWFILNDNCWSNTWNKQTQDAPLKEVWNKFQRGLWAVFQKAVSGLLRGFVDLINNQRHELLNNANFVRFMGSSIMKTLQSTLPKNAIPLPEALHFQRLIRIIHCRDVEIEIPIPVVNGEPEWDICQRAWWDAINIIYRRFENDGSIPINLTLEMRIMVS